MITYMVLEKLRDHLKRAMIDNIPEDDPTRADVVKIGRFQENPRVKNIHISISGGSQTDPEMIDGIVTVREFERIGVRVPPREVGQGQLWWRRGEVKIGCFFISEKIEEEMAADLAYTVYGRLQSNIENLRIGGLRDEFGETAIQIYCFASNFMESGGNNRYIWRGSVKWQFLSERPLRGFA